MATGEAESPFFLAPIPPQQKLSVCSMPSTFVVEVNITRQHVRSVLICHSENTLVQNQHVQFCILAEAMLWLHPAAQLLSRTRHVTAIAAPIPLTHILRWMMALMVRVTIVSYLCASIISNTKLGLRIAIRTTSALNSSTPRLLTRSTTVNSALVAAASITILRD